METSDPQVSRASSTHQSTSKPRKSIAKRMLIGFCTGGSLPALLGAYGLYQFNVFIASVPRERFACGNGSLGPLMILILGTPLLGLIGAVVAAALP